MIGTVTGTTLKGGIYIILICILVTSVFYKL